MKETFFVEHILLGGEFIPLFLFHSVDSTNLVAWRLLEAGFESPFSVLAVEQRAGYGRHRRMWVSPPNGGVYISFVRSADLEHPQLATLAAAVAVKETVLMFAPNAALSIRYPNDVLVDGNKISGILAELGKELVVGVGLNLRTDALPRELRYATALDSLCSLPSSSVVALTLIRGIHQKLRLLASGGAGVIIEEVERSGAVGVEVRVTDMDGTELCGFAERIDGDGVLILRCGDGEFRRIVAADVRLLRTGGEE